MKARDLLKDPVWQGTEVGRPLPDSIHAVSMALPRWADVVGYEERRPEVVDQLKLGYPRFVFHPLVRELARRLVGDEPGLPFPSASAAEGAAGYVQRTSGAPAQVVSQSGVFGVVTTAAGAQALKDFWQHTGLIVCSRQAEAALAGQGDCSEAASLRATLRQQLAAFYHCAPDDVFLAPTGMAAQKGNPNLTSMALAP